MGRGAQPARWGPRTAPDVLSRTNPARVGGTWVATRGAGQGSAAVWGERGLVVTTAVESSAG